MTISNAFSNAASGLAASARAVQVASANIANVLTPGYAPRQLDLVASTLGGASGGVRMVGISRAADPGLIALTRDSAGAAGAGDRLATFWSQVEQAFGLPGEGVSAALAAFDSALLAAADRPDLETRLAAVVTTANDLVRHTARIEGVVQSARAQADAAIARDVEAMNSGLKRIDTLNDQIIRQKTAGHSTLSLEDERQALISTLSEIVPLREHVRDDGRVALFTLGGALLLDLQPAELGFAPTAAIDAGMSLGSGLSGLTLRGRAVDTSGTGPLGGGRLAASFQIRDVEAPLAQTQIDEISRALINRFADPATDPTLAPGLPGLFTDAGALAGLAPGLAGRLAVNSVVQPPDALWHLRDGLGATAPGPLGEAAGLNALIDALERRLSDSPGSPARSLALSLGEALSTLSGHRQRTEDAAALSRGRHAELVEQGLATGVDTDAEMQRLLLIEQAYAANARVIETADAMLRRLLEI